MPKLSELLTRNEVLVALIIVVLSAIIWAINPAYLSTANIFRTVRSGIVIGILAMGVMVVLISGGIDVSFMAIAIFSLYSTTKILMWMGYTGPFEVAFLIGGGIGLLLGLFNGFFIAIFRLPTLIVTLGTLSLFRGFMLFFIGSTHISDVPEPMKNYYRAFLLEFTPPSGRGMVNLHATVLILVIAAIVCYLLLRYTTLGRGIYAMGGDREAAARAGFNIRRIQFFIYGFAGMIYGVAGVTFGVLQRPVNPFDLVGNELEVLAAVVLGGASIMGGRGGVIGTLLGVLLITIVSNNLVMVGIPSDWQRVMIGALLIIGMAIPAIQAQRSANMTVANAGD